jgi:hypothetical protein
MANLDNEIELTNAEARAAAAVSHLRRPAPPAGLAKRTLARLAGLPKRTVWYLRPITHPLARIAAAAVIIYTLAPLTDFDLAAPLGAKLQAHIISSQVADKVAGVVDRLLLMAGPQNYSQSELEALMNMFPPHTTRASHPRTTKYKA